MGIVYRARKAGSQDDVAVKVLLAGGRASERQRRRFLREAEALGKLSHPNLLPVLDAGEEGEQLYLVLPWAPGESLQQRLDRSGPLPVPEALQVVAQMCAAVSHAHAQGVLHRDLKPANVLLDAAGTPLLTDFGLAGDVDPSLSRSRLTQEGQFMGTPGYWAPEQASGDLGLLGPATDVYGLGALLYALLTGGPPGGDTLVAALDPQQLVPASSLNPDVPGWLDRALARALQPRPADRYPGSDAFARALVAGASRGRPWGPAVAVVTILLVLVVGKLLVAAGVRLLAAGRPARPTAVDSSAPPAPPATPIPGATPAATVVSAEVSPPPLAPDPHPGRVHFERGVALGREAAWEDAVAAYDEALRLEPRLAEAHFNRAHALGMLGDAAGAAAGYTELLRLQPAHPRALNNRGLELGRAGDWPAALKDFDAAIQVDPDYARAHDSRGVAWASLEEWALAEEAYTRALTLDPTLAGVHERRARARASLGRLNEAIEDYTAHLRLEPDDARGYAARGRLHGRLESWRGQIDDLKRAILLEPSHAAHHVNLGSSHVKVEEWDAALASYTRALELQPDFADAYLNRARVRQLGDDVEGALADYAAGLRLRPSDAYARSTLGDLRADTQDPEGALLDYTLAIELGTLSAARLAQVHASRGDMHRLLGRRDETLSDYARAVELDPTLVEPLYFIANDQLTRGQLEPALAGFSRVLELDPDNASAWSNRAHTKNALGDHEGALSDASQAIALPKRLPEAFATRGEAYQALGRLEEAIEDYERALELAPDASWAPLVRDLVSQAQRELSR
jgi:tetratricopeptide (TPR) repeat protein